MIENIQIEGNHNRSDDKCTIGLEGNIHRQNSDDRHDPLIASTIKK
jgi:hypothetical protein